MKLVTLVMAIAGQVTWIRTTQPGGRGSGPLWLADRVTSVQITSDEGVALPATTTDYDPTSGMVTATHAGAATITREYDLLGRVLTYTDADGGVTRSEFDKIRQAVEGVRQHRHVHVRL